MINNWSSLCYNEILFFELIHNEIMAIIETPYNFSAEFSKLCHEVLSKTPLDYFSISRVYKNGTYNALMTDPKWVEHYLANHYNNTIQPNVKHYQVSQVKDYELWSLSSMYGQSQDMEALYQDCCLFGYSNGITFVEEYDHCYELYWFSSSYKEGIDHYFIENINYLRLLTLQIKEKLLNDKQLRHEFAKAYQIPNDDNNQITEPHVKLSFKELGLKQYYLGGTDKQNYFTEKETLCLLYLIKGHTIKSIAQVMQLSPRTIETHLNHIKCKSKVNNLNDLRVKFAGNNFVKSLLLTL